MKNTLIIFSLALVLLAVACTSTKNTSQKVANDKTNSANKTEAVTTPTPVSAPIPAPASRQSQVNGANKNGSNSSSKDAGKTEITATSEKNKNLSKADYKQKNVTAIDTTKKIQFDRKSGIIQFTNGKQIKMSSHKYYQISPNCKKVAALKSATTFDTITTITIYNINGDSVLYHIKPLNNVAIADDGRFVIYGYIAGDIPAYWANLNFYSSNGKEIKTKFNTQKYYTECYALFSSTGNILFFIHEFVTSQKIIREYFLFDENFNLIKQQELKDSPKASYDPSNIKINEDLKQIEMMFYTGVRMDGKSKYIINY